MKPKSRLLIRCSEDGVTPIFILTRFEGILRDSIFSKSSFLGWPNSNIENFPNHQCFIDSLHPWAPRRDYVPLLLYVQTYSLRLNFPGYLCHWLSVEVIIAQWFRLFKVIGWWFFKCMYYFRESILTSKENCRTDWCLTDHMSEYESDGH